MNSASQITKDTVDKTASDKTKQNTENQKCHYRLQLTAQFIKDTAWLEFICHDGIVLTLAYSKRKSENANTYTVANVWHTYSMDDDRLTHTKEETP